MIFDKLTRKKTQSDRFQQAFQDFLLAEYENNYLIGLRSESGVVRLKVGGGNGTIAFEAYDVIFGSKFDYLPFFSQEIVAICAL